MEARLTRRLHHYKRVQALSDQIMGIWVDPTCGNGLCEKPTEYPAYGHPENRFGCEEDCGNQPNVTTIALHLDYTQPVQGDRFKHIPPLLGKKCLTGPPGHRKGFWAMRIMKRCRDFGVIPRAREVAEKFGKSAGKLGGKGVFFITAPGRVRKAPGGCVIWTFSNQDSSYR